MIDANHVPPVANDELLARFITQSKQFRSSDQSVKPDLFIPFRLTELSVTRHRDATADELWQVGRDVAALRQQKLYGRADVRGSGCGIWAVFGGPVPGVGPGEPVNTNHA